MRADKNGWLGSRADSHEPECLYRRAVHCPLPIECDHGFDVCPACDPCTCDKERRRSRRRKIRNELIGVGLVMAALLALALFA